MLNSVHFRFSLPIQKPVEHRTERKSSKAPETGFLNTEIPHIPAYNLFIWYACSECWMPVTASLTLTLTRISYFSFRYRIFSPSDLICSVFSKRFSQLSTYPKARLFLCSSTSRSFYHYHQSSVEDLLARQRFTISRVHRHLSSVTEGFLDMPF